MMTFKGYQVFTILEVRKMVIVSLGSSEKDKKLEVSDVKYSPKETTVTVKRIPASKANEKNPYILIGLDKIEEDLIVQDESGDRFEETDYQQ
ncbi:putative lipoprotein (fragment) [Bacillus subtilis]